MSIAVKVENVSMKFNMSKEKIDSIKEYFVKLVKGKLMYTEFYALTDISFEIKKSWCRYRRGSVPQ